MSHVNIMGVRGIPAAHGGFETFAGRLAPHLRDRGHRVTVYCQDEDGDPRRPRLDMWNGIQRVHITPRLGGALGTMEFDLGCVRDVMHRPGTDLVLGYNTAVFNLLQVMRGRTVVMNMDGIEWQRSKWSLPAKSWFWLNEIIGANLARVPIADHPEIARHTRARSVRTVEMIPYGADALSWASPEPVRALGLVPQDYVVSIARIEPENSILEMVRAFAKVPAPARCVVLGRLDAANAYHRAVRAAAGERVMFPGAIYDAHVVEALRFHAAAYLHGHRVGGTNPSLVEALGAGSPVIAHDNRFNRWTAGRAQAFFTDERSAAGAMNRLLGDRAARALASRAARARHAEAFEWPAVLAAYERILCPLPTTDALRYTADECAREELECRTSVGPASR